MRRYKILYTQTKASETIVSIIDFIKGKTIELSLNDLSKNDQVDPSLKKYVSSQLTQIKKGYWDYQE